MNPHGSLQDIPASDPPDVEREQMKAHDITCDGTSYFFGGYRDSELGHALNDARLMRERPELPGRGHAAAASEPAAAPTEAARELMARLGIDRVEARFRLGGFRDARLEEAVAPAKLTAQRRGLRRETP